jgi:hypothetical protein
MCINSGYYDYITQTGQTGYVWTVTSGGTITAGQNTADLQVVWTTPGPQTITVNYYNGSGCTAPTPTVFNVMVSGLPDAAGAITGTSSICAGTNGIAYSVPPINNAVAYVWSLPAGAAIASGAGTNSITVDFAANAVSGLISVYGNSVCGNGTASPAFAVTINQIPLAAGTVSGTDSVCAGETGIAYSVAPVTNATGYVWTLPTGANIASGANTPNITVDFAVNALSGPVSVYGTNACGNGTVSPSFPVVVKSLPATPVIINHGDTLYSSATAGNQWYYNGAPITTGNGQVYVAHTTGWYWDVVTLSGCSSDTSNHIFILVTGTNDPAAASFVVYPVPNDGQFKLQMNSPFAQSFDISICNTIGSVIYTKKNVEVNGAADLVIDLRPIAPGVYTMVISEGNSKVVRKIVVKQ